MASDVKELMAKVGKIRILTNKLIDDQLSGDYHSTFKGQGVEFDEVRPYTVGDDVRTIDWNVTARTGAPYIKRYSEERELTVLFMVDVSGSQSYGSRGRTKAELAAEESKAAKARSGEKEDTGEYTIVRTKHFSIKPMDEQEAIMQMNMVNHDFYVFRDAKTEEISVVYRRADGNYGLIQPGAQEE